MQAALQRYAERLRPPYGIYLQIRVGLNPGSTTSAILLTFCCR
ncbi:MAG TPA: hypothetical protein VGX03_19510 [Candidatus Binatia bacterium]|jgi:hypothetical protein|nr:hypothetical protein [Candidatus Binatia bacterium]